MKYSVHYKHYISYILIILLQRPFIWVTICFYICMSIIYIYNHIIFFIVTVYIYISPYIIHISCIYAWGECYISSTCWGDVCKTLIITFNNYIFCISCMISHMIYHTWSIHRLRKDHRIGLYPNICTRVHDVTRDRLSSF